MPELYKSSIDQLKEACNLSGARWAAWLLVSAIKNANGSLVKTTGKASSKPVGKSSSKANNHAIGIPGRTWELGISCFLSKQRQAVLLDFLQNQEVASWLAGGLSSGRIRSRHIGIQARSLSCSRIYAFPSPRTQTLILVGGEELGKDAQRIFKMLSLQDISPYFSSNLIRLSQEEKNLLPKANISTEPLILIHQIIQNIAGIKDVSEIAQKTAELIALSFNVGFSAVILSVETGKELVIEGVGGDSAQLILKDYRYESYRGITGQVFSSGTNSIINDVSLVPEYFSFPGWQAGSEICVALRDGEQVFGLINVERADKNSFTEQDFLVLESLAGIVSSLMIIARRFQELDKLYQELQDRIQAQQMVQLEDEENNV